MLEELRISNVGVIAESLVPLHPGLNVLTGETGAGKTMIVSSLGLLSGGRADAGVVRSGTGQARVEGVFRVLPGALAERVEALGGVIEEERLLLARTVSSEGRSRAFIGGAGTTVAAMAEVAPELVAIHGQSDQLRLLSAKVQRDALDLSGGPELAAAKAEYRVQYEELGAVERELAELRATLRERAQEADLLRFGVDEITALDPQRGEDTHLRAEERRLGDVESLRTAASTARDALSSEEGGDALSAAAAARRLLDGVRDSDAEVAALADRLAEVIYLLSDLAADLAGYVGGLEGDPIRLAAVQERRAALASLTRKYGESVEEVLAWAETAGQRLLELDGGDERIEALSARRTVLRSSLAEAAARLSRLRAEAAERLGAAVTRELAQLAMPHARFLVMLSHRVLDVTAEGPVDEQAAHAPLLVEGQWLEYARSGVDEVEFQLAANVGAEPRALARSASGGELSRVMLAVEVSLAEVPGEGGAPTFVFDEVDAGVGGAAAVEVGGRLAALAQSAQVIVVTHLPQVAAFADHHLVIRKENDGTVTTSSLSVLDSAGREHELSRMLAGLESSETALAHARELLGVAARAKG